ncbi:response regulator transcription factor [Chloroflexota bacterium]|nr:response regulator transcription factor [Chloroflexota bacterium]
MAETINLAILEDHQATIDGYIHRLSDYPNIKIVGSCLFSECLKSLLKKKKVDMLILDINVPISEENRNIQPIHKLLAELKLSHPELSILVISMHSQRAMIKSILESGTSGYILKDDYDSIRNLGKIIETLAEGGSYMSNRVRDIFFNGHAADFTLTPRELEVLSVCAAYPDENTAVLAERLDIANPTVRNFLHKIYLKLQVHGRAAAILKAQEMGLIPSVSSPQDNQNG